MTTSIPVTPKDINDQLDKAAQNGLAKLIDSVNTFLNQNWDDVQLTVDLSPYVEGLDRRIVKRLSVLVVKEFRNRGWVVNAHAEIPTHLVFSVTTS